MSHRYRQRRPELVPAQPVCQLAGTKPGTPSQWARETFAFEPTPKQAEVLDSPANYLILCCNRQWGETTTVALKALHHALYHDNQSIVALSRTKDQAALLIEVVAAHAIRLGHPVRRYLGQRHSFVLANGSRIQAIAHHEDTSLGRTANILIVDEAVRVTDKVYFAVSAFTARTAGSVWMLSTPKRQLGFFYNFWHSQDARWHRIFSTVADCPGIDPAYLAMLRTASPTQYAQDFECRFVPSDAALTSRDFVSRMLYSPEELRQRANRR